MGRYLRAIAARSTFPKLHPNRIQLFYACPLWIQAILPNLIRPNKNFYIAEIKSLTWCKPIELVLDSNSISVIVQT